MRITEIVRVFFRPNKEDLVKYPFFRKHFSWRVFADRIYSKPQYANERTDEDLPERLQWIRRRHFILLGDNWLDHDSKKPIAILWSFSAWKREIISNFLPEYRVAIPRQKYPFFLNLYSCWKVRGEGVVFVVWSYNEPLKAKIIARLMGLKFLRMEDGFIRSGDLGVEHALPESLVLEKKGMYFDAHHVSDIEQIINDFDFDAEDGRKLLDKAQGLIKIVKDLGVTKYNLRTYEAATRLLGPPLKKRILVLGQVEVDASIGYGKAEGWTNALLLKLAIAENPGAEIIYRPHPDVAKGLARFIRRIRPNTLPSNVYILDKAEVSLREIFDLVDHVYTITSLSGFEALLHGVKVTVVGAPFYAGWGLTDDRQQHPRRQKKLTLEELFCCVYLLYPRYRGNSTTPDKLVGLLSAIFSVTGASEASLAKRMNNDLEDSEVAKLFGSRNWPVLLSERHRTKINEPSFRKIIQSVGGYHLVLGAGRAARTMMAYIFAGLIKEDATLDVFLKNIRPLMHSDDFGALIADLWKIRPHPLLMEQWTWYVNNVDDKDHLHELLEEVSFKKIPERSHSEVEEPEVYFSLAVQYIEDRKITEAERILKDCALMGIFTKEILWHYAEVMRLRFDFLSAAYLLKLLTRSDFEWRKGTAFAQLAIASNLAGNRVDTLHAIAVLSRINSERLGAAMAVEGDLYEDYGPLPLSGAFIAAEDTTASRGAQSLRRARGLILSEQHVEAEKLLRKSYDRNVDQRRFTFLLSQSLSFQGKLEEAKKLLSRHLDESPSPQLFSEALRVSIMKGDYIWASDLLQRAESMDLEVAEVNQRKILLGLGQIGESYRSFRRGKASIRLRKYLPSSYLQCATAINESGADNVIVISSSGPGDEIRFASMYRSIVSLLENRSVCFTCDPRLLTLLKRALPELNFLPTARTRSLSRKTPLSNYTDLPGSDLHVFTDNVGWHAIKDAAAVALDTDLLGDVISDYSSFNGKAYLLADPDKVNYYRPRFSKISKPIVGISWRSSLTTHSRNEHYLEIEQLMPIFELEGIQFVNLQYDNCQEELAKIEARFPGRLIDLTGVDQYNDFESVAACMCSMDLIISPVTTVTELAGSLGKPTWLLSNSSELHWRKRPIDGLDVWHSSIRHIEGEVLGNKDSLVKQLKIALMEWRNNFN
ncbi:hypothetical protein H0484_04585 [Pusillimonas sp. CC-YST705]|uniref:Capsule polysaccharide biosynthesis protein n=1 Tax=Mesopusillimonas faecipullorum TaxID=2755040 RepID=A0ABS8CAH0_9BURK|nr:hypothetical protein [Mesopusillimonas faecipullorum]MCB5363030.1 hypothetical protein [Mesopusillimonas faecipullorum]